MVFILLIVLYLIIYIINTINKLKLTDIRDFIFIDKAKSESEYQRVQHCIDWCDTFTCGHLAGYPYDNRLFNDENDKRDMMYDLLYDIPHLVRDLYKENSDLKQEIKNLKQLMKR